MVVSDVASLFSALLCFPRIGKQTLKNEFVIWKDSWDQVFLNRIQDVIFELHYLHQGKERENKREESESREETSRNGEKTKVKEDKEMIKEEGK